MRKSVQISESIRLGILLALSGGFMDAYSYLARGKVFANAQTGNMLLLGVHLSQGHFSLALHYFFPVCAFAIGIILADIIRSKVTHFFHWRQIAVFIEAIILLIVSLLPLDMNLLANALTSLSCGIQVESFRKIHGHVIATTMCIGNLRSGTESISQYILTKERVYLKKALLYYGIILCFIVGAIIGNETIQVFHEKAIIGSCILLIFVSLLMFVDKESKIDVCKESM